MTRESRHDIPAENRPSHGPDGDAGVADSLTAGTTPGRPTRAPSDDATVFREGERRDAPAIAVRDVEKRFGAFTALSGVNLDIADNEFFTLLGPSGCGKTTLLRMIAGFEDTTAGEIFLYGDEIENLPPDRRPVNTVFQHYALFPHMNVSENIGFGLRMLRWSADAIRRRIAEMIALVKLEEFAHRKPAQLSGGQQQRVALARAMAPRPKVLLLDEPLSALDLKLRQAMRDELKALQRETGITFVFVTHDQEEALSMSDRIAVMSAGRVRQIGTPSEIYESPLERFVATFIGETNLLDARVVDAGAGHLRCRLANGHVVETTAGTALVADAIGTVSIRPERLSMRPALAPATGAAGNGGEADEPSGGAARDPSADALEGTLESTVYLGTDVRYAVALDGGPSVIVRSQNTADGAMTTLAPGTRVHVGIARGAARFLAD